MVASWMFMFDGSMQELAELGYGFDSFWQRGDVVDSFK